MWQRHTCMISLHRAHLTAQQVSTKPGTCWLQIQSSNLYTIAPLMQCTQTHMVLWRLFKGNMRLRLVRFSSVRCGPTEPWFKSCSTQRSSLQLGLGVRGHLALTDIHSDPKWTLACGLMPQMIALFANHHQSKPTFRMLMVELIMLFANSWTADVGKRASLRTKSSSISSATLWNFHWLHHTTAEPMK